MTASAPSTSADSGSSLMEKIVALTKRRGFIFQSSELYGGINGAWDYGPMGVLLKRNVRTPGGARWSTIGKTSSDWIQRS